MWKQLGNPNSDRFQAVHAGLYDVCYTAPCDFAPWQIRSVSSSFDVSRSVMWLWSITTFRLWRLPFLLRQQFLWWVFSQYWWVVPINRSGSRITGVLICMRVCSLYCWWVEWEFKRVCLANTYRAIRWEPLHGKSRYAARGGHIFSILEPSRRMCIFILILILYSPLEQCTAKE